MEGNFLNSATQAALALQDALREGGFAFCVIGGLAVQRWGEPRMTRDADATVLTEFVNDERLVEIKEEPEILRRLEEILRSVGQ